MRVSRDGAKRASVSGGICSRDSTRTPRLIVRNGPPQRCGERPVAGIEAGIAARQLHHEARIDAVLAGRDAVAAAAARLAPAYRRLVALAAGDQIDDRAGGFRRVGVADAGRAGHRAGTKAVAAPDAGIRDRGAARPERVGQVGSVGMIHPVLSRPARAARVGNGSRFPSAPVLPVTIYHDLGGTTALRNPKNRCVPDAASHRRRRFAPCIAACQKCILA